MNFKNNHHNVCLPTNLYAYIYQVNVLFDAYKVI